MPQISVIIPVYNAAATLRQTLASVEAQSYRNFEVVVVNDGSSDQSAEIIEEWMRESELELQMISQQNQGLGASRNRGIEAAKGDWIALLDADDIWDEHKLANILKCLEGDTAEVIYHRVLNFSGNKKHPRATSPVRDIHELLTNSNPLVPSAVLIKRSAALQHPFSEKRELHGAEDLHLWVRLLAAGVRFKFEPGALTLYRVEGGMSSDIENHLQYVFNALKCLREDGFIDFQVEAGAIARKHYEAGRFYQKQKQFQRATEHYSKGQVKGLKANLVILANRFKLAV